MGSGKPWRVREEAQFDYSQTINKTQMGLASLRGRLVL